MSLLGYGISWIKICHNATCIRTTRRGIRQHFFESARSTITSTVFHIVVGKMKQQKIWREARALKGRRAQETNA